MKISVALCTFNGEKYLRELLESLDSQILRPDELVVCDDHSTDLTVEIIKEFSLKAKFEVRLFINENTLGSTKNFEKAIRRCKGDIIFLCDQDDVWRKDKIAQLMTEFIQHNSIGAVISDAEVVAEDLSPLGYNLWQAFNFAPEKFSNKQIAPDFLLNHNVVTGTTMAFRKEFIDLLTPIPDSWVHDEWIAILIATVSRVTFIQEPLIKYRQHNANQIGGLKKSLPDMLRPAHHQNPSFFLKKYKYLLARLYRRKGYVIDLAVLKELKQKIQHLGFRSSLPKNPIKRAFFITQEMIKLGYHRYSNGFFSAAKDLLFK